MAMKTMELQRVTVAIVVALMIVVVVVVAVGVRNVAIAVEQPDHTP